jgi:hypothetical protein
VQKRQGVGLVIICHHMAHAFHGLNYLALAGIASTRGVTFDGAHGHALLLKSKDKKP